MDDHQVLRGLFFGVSYPWIVSIVVALVIALFVTHALLAMRKFPIDYRQFATFRTQMRFDAPRGHHFVVLAGDCRFCDVLSAPGHLYMMLTRPDRIGPSNRLTACGASIGGRCTSCYCSRWSCTAASGFTGLQ